MIFISIGIIGLLEGSRNEAYLDGISDPDSPTKFISAAKFYAFDDEKQKKLKDACERITGNRSITTVGIGANIETERVRDRFDKLLGDLGLMQQIYYGKAKLTDEQVDIIFKDCVDERLVELHKIYGSDWDKLRINEQITILSLYFNHRKLVGGHTNFRKHIKNYIKTNNEIHLRRAVEEVVKKSNPNKNVGIQNRRDAEGALLASYNSLTYTKPNEFPDVVKVKIAAINDTIIPLNDDSPIDGINSAYFIWRTKMDEKVREEHMLLEGKIFRKNDPPKYMPGTMHNCRCHDEEVPDYVLIKDAVAEKKSF